MENTSTKLAVEQFLAHVREQARKSKVARITRQKQPPTAEQKDERNRLMQQLVVSFGLTRGELIARLGIDRATWDRWRSMTTVPHRSSLDQLEQLANAEQQAVSTQPTNSCYIDDPGVILLGSDRTWGRLRLAQNLFPWENMVFVYDDPPADEESVLDIALLAFRGTSIVFIMPDPQPWSEKFTLALRSILNGWIDCQRVLSKICIIKSERRNSETDRDHGYFNFGTEDCRAALGYSLTQRYSANSSRDPSTKEVYTFFPYLDDRLVALGEKYGSKLYIAFTQIKEQNFGCKPPKERYAHYPKMRIVVVCPDDDLTYVGDR